MIALSSLPDYNPNDPKTSLDETRLNRLIAGVYELGSTFKAITFAMALDEGAGRQVHDAGGLAEAVLLYLEQGDLRVAAGEAARTMVDGNRGALGRTLELIEQTLRRPGTATSAGLASDEQTHQAN